MVEKNNPISRFPMCLVDAIAALLRANPLPRTREPKPNRTLKASLRF